MSTELKENWETSTIPAFFGSTAHNEHIVYFYENDEQFMEMLTGYTISGLIGGDTIVIIATAEHRASLEDALQIDGFYIAELIASNRYLAFDAHETLSEIMVDGWPSKERVAALHASIAMLPHAHNAGVRLFGETVSLLWQMGCEEATFELENIWNELQEKQNFTVLCAYPMDAFENRDTDSLEQLCSMHQKRISINVTKGLSFQKTGT